MYEIFFDREVSFGKHKGLTGEQIARLYPKYIFWALDTGHIFVDEETYAHARKSVASISHVRPWDDVDTAEVLGTWMG